MNSPNEIWQFAGKHAFLSNFWITPVTYDGRTWKSAEHAYQAAKSLDEDYRVKIAMADSPGQAKRLGKAAPLREDWSLVKVAVMGKVLHSKFAVPEMRESLISTGTALLVEGNTWGDTFWGVDIRTRVGKNFLGKILMSIRESLVSFD